MAKTIFYDKKEFQNIMVMEKKRQFFFRKIGLPAKQDYLGNRNLRICEIFFFLILS